MGGKRWVVVAVATVCFLLAASSASAAEAGDDCVANTVEANRTMIPWNSSGSFTMNRAVGELVLGEGVQHGVITGWRVRVGSGQPTLPQRFETYRVLNEKEEYRQESQSQLESVGPGESFFGARVPVWPGANLGLYGPEGTFACNTGESLVTGTFIGSASVGEVRTVTGLFGFRTPLTVVVERDIDNDGYGDESQDKCPEFAAIQANCPFVRLTPSVSAITKRAILLNVSTGDATQVQVSGQVGWPIRPKPGARPSKGKARRIVGLSGGTQEIPAGATVAFTVPLPKAVRRRLKKLDPKEKLKARLTVLATDLVGHQTASHLTVRLPGPKIVVTKR